MLRISDLTIEYAQGRYVVRPIEGLDLEAEDGQLVILLGPSGSGKTTLLSCLAALLKPAKGRIELDGTDVTALARGELQRYRRHRVGIIFQAFNLVPSLTARENVAAPLRLAGASRGPAHRRADELLERVNLSDRAGHRPAQLSGGQQQRVAIARALVHDPPLIVADEPTAHLDFRGVEEVLLLIRELASPGRLVVVATHDDRFNPLADRVVELVSKRLGEEPTSRKVRLTAGEVLFREGDEAELVYVVEEGRVELYRELVGGGEEVIITLDSGRWFGDMGPLLGQPRSASARALEPALLTGLGLQAFRRWRAGQASPTASPRAS